MEKSLKPEKNSRQLPSVKELCANKNYNDIMYAHLQLISDKNRISNTEIERFIPKSEINFTVLGRKFGISRQTASKYFKNLMNMGLIEEDKELNRYILIKIPKDQARLIPLPTVKLLVDSLSERAISTYIFLLGLYWANGCQSYILSLKALKSFVGLSNENKHTHDIFTNIFLALKKIGLIDYEKSQVSDLATPGLKKTQYKVLQVNVKIEELEGC